MSDNLGAGGAAVLPFSGTRVLDLGTLIAAPLAGQIMSDLGAEVLKIEPPQGEALRGLGGPVGPSLPEVKQDRPYNRRPWFNELNRAKLGMSLNLAHPAGINLVKELSRQVDVLLENFSPRVMKNFGLDYPVLRRENPSLIMVSVSAFGATGPYKDRIGFGPNIDAASGITYLTGYADGRPLKPGNYFSDFFSGLHAAFAVTTALWHRKHTGRGQYIDMAMREANTQIVADAILDFAMNRRIQKPLGNRHASMAPHGCYPCKGEDRWVTIAVSSDEEWKALARVLGQPAWITDGRFSTQEGRRQAEDVIDQAISSWTIQRESREVMGVLQESGIPAGAVQQTADVLQDPQVSHRQYFSYVHHPEFGRTPIRNLPFRLSATPVRVERPAPCFGQDTVQILGELLGMNGPAIASLYEVGVINKAPTRRAEA